MRCIRCDGEGLVPVSFTTADQVSHLVDLPCPACHGSGRIHDNENAPPATPVCDGKIVEDALD